MTELIKRNPLFSGLDENGLGQIKGITTSHFLKKGGLLFSQGEGASGFYLVVKGKIKIFRLSPQGQEYILRIVGPGKPLPRRRSFRERPIRHRLRP